MQQQSAFWIRLTVKSREEIDSNFTVTAVVGRVFQENKSGAGAKDLKDHRETKLIIYVRIQPEK